MGLGYLSRDGPNFEKKIILADLETLASCSIQVSVKLPKKVKPLKKEKAPLVALGPTTPVQEEEVIEQTLEVQLKP